MDIPVLVTERLLLRPFTAADAAPLHRIVSQDGILRYFRRPEPPDLAGVEQHIAGKLADWQEHGFGRWAVERSSTSELRCPDAPTGTGALLGWCGLQRLDETGEVEISFLLDRSCWGQGLATEAARAALRFGLETLGLGSITGLVHPENAASQRVLEKAGMTFVNEVDILGMRQDRYVVTANHFGDYYISTDPRRLDPEAIHAFLDRGSYWAQGRPLDVVRTSLAHSLCFGVYAGAEQVGLARVVTDTATFAWVGDVFIVEKHRGHGLGKWLIECVVTHPDLRGVRQVLLATRDAHELYRRYGGFDALPVPERWMIRRKRVAAR